MRVLKIVRAYLHKLKIDIFNDWSVLVVNFKTDGGNIPNRITEVRLLCSLLPGVLLFVGQHNPNFLWWSFCAFVLVTLTDMLDGALARGLNQVTDLGKALDPIVDKFLISATTISILMVYPELWLPIIVTLVSEATVFWSVFRAKHRGLVIRVTKIGKLRMVIQCLAVACCLLPVAGLSLKWWLMALASAVSAISMSIYLKSFYVKTKVKGRD